MNLLNWIDADDVLAGLVRVMSVLKWLMADAPVGVVLVGLGALVTAAGIALCLKLRSQPRDPADVGLRASTAQEYKPAGAQSRH